MLSRVADTRYVEPDITFVFSLGWVEFWNKTFGSALLCFPRRSSLNRDRKLERDFFPDVFFRLPEFLAVVRDFFIERGVMKLNLYLETLDGVFFTFFMILVFVFTS